MGHRLARLGCVVLGHLKVIKYVPLHRFDVGTQANDVLAPRQRRKAVPQAHDPESLLRMLSIGLRVAISPIRVKVLTIVLKHHGFA